MSPWGIPKGVQELVKARDKRCVYCRKPFKVYARGIGGRATMATWEHINNDDLKSHDNVVLCCGACNSSKGTKQLAEWFESEYCAKNGINVRTVARFVKNWIKQQKLR